MKKFLSFMALALTIIVLNSCDVDTKEPDPYCYYKVYHCFENIQDNEYTSDGELQQTLTGLSGKETQAVALEVTGFNAKEIQQKILGKSNNDIYVYYDRIRTTVTFNGNGGTVVLETENGTQEESSEVSQTGKYGQLIQIPAFKKDGFSLSGWKEDFIETYGLEDKSYVAEWTLSCTKTGEEGITDVHYIITSMFPDYSWSGDQTYGIFDICGGTSNSSRLILWKKKDTSYTGSENQHFYFEPTDKGENVYRISATSTSSSTSTQSWYFMLHKSTDSETAKTSKALNNTDLLNELMITKDISKAVEFQLISIYRKENPYKSYYLLKIYGTEDYITAGPAKKSGSTGLHYNFSGGDEPILYFTSLITDENGIVNSCQLFDLTITENQ